MDDINGLYAGLRQLLWTATDASQENGERARHARPDGQERVPATTTTTDYAEQLGRCTRESRDLLKEIMDKVTRYLFKTYTIFNIQHFMSLVTGYVITSHHTTLTGMCVFTKRKTKLYSIKATPDPLVELKSSQRCAQLPLESESRLRRLSHHVKTGGEALRFNVHQDVYELLSLCNRLHLLVRNADLFVLLELTRHVQTETDRGVPGPPPATQSSVAQL